MGIELLRPSLYARCNLRPVEYEEEVFMKFLDVYTEGLNASFTHDTGIEKRSGDYRQEKLCRSFLLLWVGPSATVAAYQAFWIYPAIFERGRIGCHGTVFCRGTSE